MICIWKHLTTISISILIVTICGTPLFRTAQCQLQAFANLKLQWTGPPALKMSLPIGFWFWKISIRVPRQCSMRQCSGEPPQETLAFLCSVTKITYEMSASSQQLQESTDEVSLMAVRSSHCTYMWCYMTFEDK